MSQIVYGLMTNCFFYIHVFHFICFGCATDLCSVLFIVFSSVRQTLHPVLMVCQYCSALFSLVHIYSFHFTGWSFLWKLFWNSVI